MQKVCFEAEGQSRIHFRQNRYLVSFESTIYEDSWYVAFDVPGRGQELIQVDYLEEEPKVQGRFAERLFFEASKENEEVYSWLEEFIEYLIFIPRQAHFAKNNQLDCADGKCIGPDGEFFYQASSYGMRITRKSSLEGVELQFDMADLESEEKWFQRNIFRLNLINRVGPEAYPAQLYLFLSRCK